jgi:hypothetical protein
MRGRPSSLNYQAVLYGAECDVPGYHAPIGSKHYDIFRVWYAHQAVVIVPGDIGYPEDVGETSIQIIVGVHIFKAHYSYTFG